MLAMLCIPFAILLSAHNRFIESINTIEPLTNDIVHVNDIIIHSVQLITESSLYAVRNKTKFMNRYIKEFIKDDIDTLSDTVSNENHFLPETLDLLVTNSCIWWEPNSGRSSCLTVLNGVIQKGVIAAIHAIENAVRQYKYKVDTLPPSPKKTSLLLSDPEFYDALYYVIYGLSPTINHIEDYLLTKLITGLNEGAHDTIIFSSWV